MKNSFAAIICIALIATGAAAQVTGPDVIVGAIPNSANYSASGGIDAFSFGTTSCNLGDTPLLWISGNNQHPVIGQAMYRSLTKTNSHGSFSTFEMVGQSWLKHGFLALAGNVCATCTGPGGSQLDPGCSDPYGASLNGSQSGLGPKSEVNATTGVFNYPFSSGSGGGSIYKRLQVSASDLGNAGANYYVEAQYVTQDDAASGNHYNNTSTRRVNISGGPTNFSASLTGSTVQETPAIGLWGENESSVVVKQLLDPNGGMYNVAFAATDQNNGWYHYEFAVHNQNADSSCRQFSVNIPNGASIQNVDFHDVAYHSGDGNNVGTNFLGTNWTANVSGTSVTWSTLTQAQSANANALRWGTTYNFRFDSNMSPGQVIATLGYYKIGGSDNVTFDEPSFLQSISGDNQAVNIGDAFAQPFRVRAISGGGAPSVGATVSFSVNNAAIQLSSSAVLTDAQGFAEVTATTTGTTGGVAVITAATDTSQVTFNASIRAFRVIWTGASGILVLITTTPGLGNMPLILAVDTPPPAVPFATAFGDLWTSILNPGAGFFAFDGIGLFGPPDPTVRTSLLGTHQKIITGLASAHGSGLQAIFQTYGVLGEIWISNETVQTF